MNADSHMMMTYAVLRVAGMAQPDAWLAANCAETIDLNTFKITIPFTDGTSFTPRLSFLPIAFREGILENWEECDIFDTDQMFHFVIPGAPINGVNQLTTPANDLAGNVTNQTIHDLMYVGLKPATSTSKYGNGIGTDIHTFGCVLHMLADTFSHQQFYGNKDDRNIPADFDGFPWTEEDKLEADGLYAAGLKDGHGQVLHLPDAPTLSYTWKRDVDGKPVVVRDNNVEWKKAIIAIYSFAKYYLGGCSSVVPLSMPDNLLQQFVDFYGQNKALYSQPQFSDAQFYQWYNTIGNGTFLDCNGNPIKDTLPDYNEIDIWWSCFQSASTQPLPESGKPTPDIYAGEIKLYNSAPFNKDAFQQTDMYKFWSSVDNIYNWMVAYYKTLGIERPSAP